MGKTTKETRKQIWARVFNATLDGQVQLPYLDLEAILSDADALEAAETTQADLLTQIERAKRSLEYLIMNTMPLSYKFPNISWFMERVVRAAVDLGSTIDLQVDIQGLMAGYEERKSGAPPLPVLLSKLRALLPADPHATYEVGTEVRRLHEGIRELLGEADECYSGHGDRCALSKERGDCFHCKDSDEV